MAPHKTLIFLQLFTQFIQFAGAVHHFSSVYMEQQGSRHYFIILQFVQLYPSNAVFVSEDQAVLRALAVLRASWKSARNSCGRSS